MRAHFSASTIDNSDADDDSSGAGLQKPLTMGAYKKAVLLTTAVSLVVSLFTTMILALIYHHKSRTAPQTQVGKTGRRDHAAPP
ncbi:hypothetical protein MTO96_000076 [Rhipicephalus appendiculatus]